MAYSLFPLLKALSKDLPNTILQRNLGKFGLHAFDCPVDTKRTSEDAF